MEITSYIPLTYAVKTNGTIHLFILIYSSQEEPPRFPKEGKPSGATMLYSIDLTKIEKPTGKIQYFKYYNFPIGGFTDIKVVFNSHERKMEIIDITDNQLITPQANGKAFDVPYTYSQKIDDNHFKVEIVFIPSSPKILSCIHTDPAEPNKNTRSTISETGAIKTILEEVHTFEVVDFYSDQTDSGHTVEFTGNPPRKGKTKNRNHSPIPFPQRRKP